MTTFLQLLAIVWLILLGAGSFSYIGEGEDWFFEPFAIGCWLTAGAVLAVLISNI